MVMHQASNPNYTLLYTALDILASLKSGFRDFDDPLASITCLGIPATSKLTRRPV